MKVIINTTKQVLLRLLLLTVFALVLVGVIAYARGYRYNFQSNTVTSTGILSVNSNPRPAKVYINSELAGATDTNLTLPYGQYHIKVEKEGYTSWEKNVSLQGEIVMSLSALLFSKSPSLTPLTNLGIHKAIPVENTDKVILISQTGNTEKDGLYLFESTSQPITIFPPLKNLLLASLLPEDVDMSSAEFDFHPNERQAIATFTRSAIDDSTSESTISYLISLDSANTELFEVRPSKDNLLAKWHEEKNKEMFKIVETLPLPIQKIASDSFQIISLSPDEKKLMYLAKDDAQLPLIIKPPLIGANQTPEERAIQKGNLYIYDKKEDKNYRIPLNMTIPIPTPTPTPSPEVSSITGATEDQSTTRSAQAAPTPIPELVDETLSRQIFQLVQWYPTSDYIVLKENNQIVLIQYDGENKETVYAGPFDPSFFGISPDWNLMVILNLNPQINQYGDLYSVGIR